MASSSCSSSRRASVRPFDNLHTACQPPAAVLSGAASRNEESTEHFLPLPYLANAQVVERSSEAQTEASRGSVQWQAEA